jgi:hypothetical protein
MVGRRAAGSSACDARGRVVVVEGGSRAAARAGFQNLESPIALSKRQ